MTRRQRYRQSRNSQQMEVTFALTKQDIWQVNKEVVKAAEKLQMGAVRDRNKVTYSTYAFMLALQFVHRPWTPGQKFCIAASIFLVVLAYSTTRAATYFDVRSRANDPHNKAKTVTLRERSFQICSMYAIGIYNWSNILKLFVTPGYISFILQNGASHSIPVAAFTDSLERSRFEDFIRQKMAEADSQKLRFETGSMAAGAWPPAPSSVLKSETDFHAEVSAYAHGPQPDPSSEVHITCDVTNSDHIYFAMRSFFRQAPRSLLGITFYVLGYFSLPLGAFRPASIRVAVVYMTVICVLWLLFTWFFYKSQLNKEAAKRPTGLPRFELTTDFNRLIINTEVSSVNYSCAKLKSIEKTPRGIYLKVATISDYILPRNSFPDKQSFENFYSSMAKAIRAGKDK